MSRLASKVAVVVGSGSGIGATIAHRFRAEGARVYGSSRAAPDGLSPAPAQADGGILRTMRADAASRPDLAHVFARVASEEGHIDILVINAGMNEVAPLSDVSEDQYDRIFGLNVRALVFAAQDAVGVMRAGGSIVLIGSIAEALGMKGYGLYGASKAAVRSLARTWANELAPRGIRVNVVSPGPIVTDRLAKAPQEVRDAVAKLVPLGRLGRTEEVAAAALFLASEESSFTTGSELFVDGGAAQING